jgi:uncharacterized protein YneF (UPF0154 family)
MLDRILWAVLWLCIGLMFGWFVTSQAQAWRDVPVVAEEN